MESDATRNKEAHKHGSERVRTLQVRRTRKGRKGQARKQEVDGSEDGSHPIAEEAEGLSGERRGDRNIRVPDRCDCSSYRSYVL